MAYALKTNGGLLSRIERGQAVANNEMLDAIRIFLEIDKAPILESELELYKQRLWALNEMLDANRMDMVSTLEAELAPIQHLPYEEELNMLYSMLVVRRALKTYDFDAAFARLDPITQVLEGTSVEVRHLYHRNMGFINFARQNTKEALTHYLRVVELRSDNIHSDAMIIANIGFCYAQLGKPVQGILYLERFSTEYTGDKLNPALSQTLGALAFCYHLIGDVQKAKELYNRQLIIAKSNSEAVIAAMAMSNLSTICTKENDYSQALDYCKEALLMVKNGDTHLDKIVTLNATLNKASCLLKMKDRDNFQAVLAKGKALAEGNEEYETMFEVLDHTSKLNDSMSLEYLENVALPQYKAGGGNTILMLLELCETLETYYRTRGRNSKKADSIALISRDAYKEILSPLALL